MSAFTSADIEDLSTARELLENPGLAARISAAVGSPIERGLDLLPSRWHSAVMNATHKAIETALELALRTLDQDRIGTPSNRWHTLAVGTTGAAGGAFGIAALAIELPLSTTIMLRSIADIARSEGENLRDVEARLQCVQVLALGGRSPSDDAAETAYFAARAAMAKAVAEAARHLAQHGALRQGAPVILQLIGQIASRFSINVSQKVAAQAVPVVGAIGGAVINTLFIDHFQDMARGHFIIRRLERRHGAAAVQGVYKEMVARPKGE